MRKLIASVFAVTAAVLWAAPALAYTVGNGSTASASTSNPIPGSPFTATFTFKDASGGVLSATAVTFSQKSGPRWSA
ncbi:MAG: hypothetical protein NVS3B21_34360 [Acidimicrobiales bacterium]